MNITDTFVQSELEGQRERCLPIIQMCMIMLLLFALMSMLLSHPLFAVVGRVLLALAIFVVYRKLKADVSIIKPVQLMLIVLSMLFLFIVLFEGGLGKTSLFIFLAMPFLIFYSTGIRFGLLFSVATLCVAWFYTGVSLAYDYSIIYDIDEIMLFSLNFLFFSLCAYFFEMARFRRAYETHQLMSELIEEKEQQEKSKEKLETANKAMYWLAERSSHAKEKFDKLLDTIDEGYFFVDMEGVIKTTNDFVSNIFGYQQGELLGTKTLDLYKHEHDREHFLELIQTKGVITNFELKMLHKNGTAIDVLLKAHLVKDQEGKPVGIEGLLADITPQKENEKILKEAKYHAEEGSKAKSRFLAVMSHELRTPIHGILGLHELLAEEADRLSEDQQENLQLVTHSAKQLNLLVDDILDLSKIEAGKTDVVVSEVLLSNYLQDVMTSFIATCREKGLGLELIIEDVPESMIVDKKLLRQVMINLLGNALKFTDAGQIRVKVRQINAQRIEFVVEDSGIGIPDGQRQVIFEPFVQIDASGESGTGLGMSIVRNFLELLGGEISVLSVVGEGSTFIFSLPVSFQGSLVTLHLDLLNNTLGQKSAASDPQAVLRQKLNVLLAEDDPIGQRIAVRRLQQAGFAVDVVASGLDAWDKLSAASHDYDLLLTDVRMPGMDGISLTRKIRQFEQDEGRERLQIIGLSAHAMDDVKRDGLDAGMDHFMTKPVEPDEIVRCVLAQMDAESC